MRRSRHHPGVSAPGGPAAVAGNTMVVLPAGLLVEAAERDQSSAAPRAFCL